MGMTIKRIALVSTGPLSGKTTLANYLQARYRFGIACHICTLVESFVEYENNTKYPYHELSVPEVFANKEFYRAALQDHALRVGFHSDDMLAYWIERTIAKARAQFDSSTLLSNDYGMVFDPIRGEKQAKYLHDSGWTIVQLQISENERARRAGEMGKSYEMIWDAMQRHPDIEGGVEFADLVLESEHMTVEMSARIIMKYESTRPEREVTHAGDTKSDEAVNNLRHGDYTTRDSTPA